MIVIHHGPSSQEVYKSKFNKKITLTSNIDRYPDQKVDDKKLKKSLSRAGISVLQNDKDILVPDMTKRTPRIMSAINNVSMRTDLMERQKLISSAKYSLKNRAASSNILLRGKNMKHRDYHENYIDKKYIGHSFLNSLTDNYSNNPIDPSEICPSESREQSANLKTLESKNVCDPVHESFNLMESLDQKFNELTEQAWESPLIKYRMQAHLKKLEKMANFYKMPLYRLLEAITQSSIPKYSVFSGITMQNEEAFGILKNEYAGIYEELFKIYNKLGVAENNFSSLVKREHFKKIADKKFMDRLIRLAHNKPQENWQKPTQELKKVQNTIDEVGTRLVAQTYQGKRDHNGSIGWKKYNENWAKFNLLQIGDYKRKKGRSHKHGSQFQDVVETAKKEMNLCNEDELLESEILRNSKRESLLCSQHAINSILQKPDFDFSIKSRSNRDVVNPQNSNLTHSIHYLGRSLAGESIKEKQIKQRSVVCLDSQQAKFRYDVSHLKNLDEKKGPFMRVASNVLLRPSTNAFSLNRDGQEASQFFTRANSDLNYSNNASNFVNKPVNLSGIKLKDDKMQINKRIDTVKSISDITSKNTTSEKIFQGIDKSAQNMINILGNEPQNENYGGVKVVEDKNSRFLKKTDLEDKKSQRRMSAHIEAIKEQVQNKIAESNFSPKVNLNQL